MFDWITHWVAEGGYAGVFALMFLENLFPPIPSEVIMPLAGFAAAQGRLDPWLTLLAGTAGTVLGAFPWYAAGYWFGRHRIKRMAARFGRWLTVSPAEVDHAILWFRRRGLWAVLIGRLVPAVRTLISVPAGIARMPMGVFLVLTTLGSAAWTAVLMLAGMMLEDQYARIERLLDPGTTIVLGLSLAIYVWRVVTYKPAVKATTQAA